MYARGTTAINPKRDIPLLLVLRNSRFITRRQLYEILELGGYEYSFKSFEWRIQRLSKAKCISEIEDDLGVGSAVYRIATRGLMHLETHGYYSIVLNSRTQCPAHVSLVHHSLALNGIRLALARAKLLAAWQSEIETASANTVSLNPLRKNYDAVIDVWNGDQISRFGLEYERTLKGVSRYDKIRAAIENEDRLGCVLYLTSGYDAALHLANQFASLSRKLAFASAGSFEQHLLETLVITHPDQGEIPFRRLLYGMF